MSEEFWSELRARHPSLREALLADARITAHYRGERHEFRSRADAARQMLRLALVSDAFLAQALYRAQGEPAASRRAGAAADRAPARAWRARRSRSAIRSWSGPAST